MKTMKLVASAAAVLASATAGAAQYGGATYYRFSITGKYTPDNGEHRHYQLSELALYDAAGNRLTTTNSISPAAKLECPADMLSQGEFSISRPFYAENIGGWEDEADEYAWRLFDGDLGTKTEQHCFVSEWTSASEEITWLTYNIRLTNGAPPVASFNIGTGDDSLTADGGACQPVSWRLEASADGVNWQTLYNVVNSGYVVDGNYAPVYSNASWLNGGTPIPVTSQYDASKFALSREVAVGSGETHRVEPKYFNFTVKSRHNPGSATSDGVWGPDCFELTEIALYDAGGVRLNLNLSLASDPEAATTALAAGEFSVTPKVESDDGNKRTYSYYTLDNPYDINWSVERVFDDNPATGGFHNNAFCHYLKPTTWFTYKMRLADDAAPVRAYNLAAGNMDENDGARTPVNWALQGSLDGVYYAPFAEEFNSSYVPQSSRTWYNGGSPIAAAAPPVPAYGIQYVVESGGTLELSCETVLDTLHVRSGGAVSVSDGAAAVWDVAKGDRLAVSGGGFTGAGEIVKTGGGTLEIGGANSLSGNVTVDAGTLAFVNASPAVDKKFFRISIKKRYDGVPVISDNYKPMEIGEIALYDASGVNVAQGLNFNDGSPEAPANEVPAGYFSITPNHASYQPMTHGENPSKMFDGIVDTKGIYSCDLSNPETGELWYPDPAAWPDPDDESTWLRFNIHLPDSANPVVAYNICAGNDTVNLPTRAPYSWRLEASADGREWTVVDEMDDCSRFTTQNSTWYNGGRKFAVAWPSDVSSVPEAATFRVASGATLALSGNELTTFKIDCASRGTVRNLAMAQGGSVYLENVAENTSAAADGSRTLPFAVEDASLDTARLASLSIYIDGSLSRDSRLTVSGGVMRVKKFHGLMLIVK